MTREKRNQLILDLMPRVRFIALKLKARIPSHIELDDLISSGVVGLINSIEHFNETLNIKLTTYTHFRIMGGMLDGLRDYDWVPRTVRINERKLKTITEKLQQVLLHNPTSREIGMELGLDELETVKFIQNATPMQIFSMEDFYGLHLCHSPLEKDAEKHTQEIPDYTSPEDVILANERMGIIHGAICRLPERKARIVFLYYFEELTMLEIAKLMGVTESRISQIHKECIDYFRCDSELIKAV